MKGKTPQESRISITRAQRDKLIADLQSYESKREILDAARAAGITDLRAWQPDLHSADEGDSQRDFNHVE